MKYGYLLLALLLAACSQTLRESKSTKGIGIVLANMDTTVRPGQDLFKYASGGWLARTEIPSEYGSWGSFHELRQSNNRILREVLERAATSQDYPEGTDQRKAADFFMAGMDSLLAENAGNAPIKPLLDQVEKLANRNDVQAFLVQEDLIPSEAFFRFGVAPDLKNSKKMAAYLWVGGIGLPERDYYIKMDPKTISTRETYRRHIATMLQLSGWESGVANRSADRVLLVETELARAMLSKEERRDPVRQYNRKAVSELSALSPTINWTSYFRGLGVKEDSIIVSEPLFLKACDRVIATYPLEDVKAYLRWTLVRDGAPYLSNAFVEESFKFNSKFLNGVEKMTPRWKRVLELDDRFIGDAIGKLYVAAVFPPEAKAKALEMVNNIRYAFADRIKGLDWMSDTTKRLALAKLNAITVKIGYPDRWRNYAGLTIDKTGSFYTNVMSASRHETADFIQRLGKPVDKAVWDITPQTVNAYYNPQFNEIVFPAGILQPPFYDYRADEAVNYGGIGAGIGHEISHGFDDEGSQFDAEGNLNNWWNAEDLVKFKAKGKALAQQFNRYEPLPGLFVQGEFTLGENIGDLGGLNAAYDGLHRYFRENDLHPGKLDGLTAEQRFFISWATIWRAKYREEALRTQILTNVHSPAMYRSNGAPSNMPEFYEAFGVRTGDKLYREPADRVKIW